MGFKADRHRFRALFTSALHDFSKNVGMRSMDAVKVTDAYQCRTEVGWDLF
jgi:hypothetical protein